jgi:eukaryotic-like serine/threonine-protein kinase
MSPFAPKPGLNETIAHRDAAKKSPDETVAPGNTPKPVPLATIDLPSSPQGLHATIDSIPSPPGLNATIDSIPSLPVKGGPAAARPQVEGYTILSELGRGGMGVVYKARQKKLNRIVALKMVLAGAHAGQEQLARFYIEAEAVAHLQQANIVQIYEVGEHAGLPYFSLEYVDGGSLSERIGGKPQPVEEAAQQVERLARAMAYAHERGVVHRDLKPANVLLTADGVPKITDFGLAKRLESDSSQTKSGTLMGTPNYMAPEQARGLVHEVGPLADVYALGVILYEMLTGRTPFLGASILDTLQQVRNQEPVPPSRLQPKVPRDLETICLKCLEKEPAKRYEGAAELAADLRRFLAGEPISARPVGAPERLWRWCQRNKRVAALTFSVLSLLVFLAVGSSVFAVVVSRQAELVRQQKIVAEKNEQLAKLARDEAQTNEQKAIAARMEADASARAAAEQRGLALEALGTLVSKVQDRLRGTPAVQQLRQDLLRTGLDGLRKVAASTQSSRGADSMMAEAHQRMGDVFLSVGQHAEGRQQYEASHKIREAIAQMIPAPADAQRNLAFSFHKLGDINLLEGKKELAEQHYGQALRLREALAAAEPDGESARIDLATSYVTLGNVSEPQEAGAYYGQALKLRQELAAIASDASRASRERDVWVMYNKLGELNLKLQDFEAARDHYGQALAQSQKLAEMMSKSVRAKVDLALAHVNVGNVELQSDDMDAAKEAFRHALDLLRPLAAEDPRNLELQTNLVLALARHGDHVEAAQKAEDLRSLAPQNALNLYNVGCCYSVCRAAVVRGKSVDGLETELQELASSYATRAVEALRSAVQRGFSDFELLRSDADLIALHDHPGYRALVAAAK